MVLGNSSLSKSSIHLLSHSFTKQTWVGGSLGEKNKKEKQVQALGKSKPGKKTITQLISISFLYHCQI
jgi:hypothetical protein